MQELLNYFIHPSKRFFIGYLISAAVIAVIFLFVHRQKVTTTSFKKYWLHPSAQLDYWYFVMIGLVKIYVIVPLVISSQSVMIWVYSHCISWFGVMHLPAVSREWVVIAYTLTLFILSDLSRYWLHRMMHAPLLWAFHKVHHSAEVLNPVTFYRVHPVENFLFGLRYALVVGLVTGIFMYFFGAKVQLWDILGANAILFVFNLIGGNLRHSHIELRYPRWLEHCFISPRQHQLHHSEYFTRFNYGGYLAIWDTMFKTLKVSKTNQPSRYGLGESTNLQYRSLTSLVFRPFRDCYLMLLDKLS